MARFIHFSDIYLDKYDNERFANYITTLLAKIEDVGAKELGVEAYFEEFSTLVNLYMDLFVVPKRFLQTPELKKIEAERTLCMQHIYNVIEIEAKNSYTDHQEAAKVLLIVAKDLRHDSYLANRMRKTSLIDAYLFDFEKPENAQLLALLDLTKAVEELKKMNLRYRELHEERSQARVQLYKQPKVHDVRMQITSLFTDITDTIFGMYVIHHSEPCRAFIEYTNARTKEFNTSFKQSRSQKRRWKKEKEADNSIPQKK